MGYPPRIKTPKGREFRKPLRERKKERKRSLPHRQLPQQKPLTSEQEVTEATLKRLHTLGNQKFASTPFSDHYDRWLTNVEAVLAEFEAHPNITPDDQYIEERTDTLANIKIQLEERRQKEATIDQKIKTLTYHKSNLQQINTQYATLAGAIKTKQNHEIKRINRQIENLKREQEKVIRMKTGFFHGISKKSREQKELDIAQQIADKQRALELALLEFNAQKKKLQDDFERKREPVLKEIKACQREVSELETDGSLEMRWFACEALIDSINTLLQRKAARPTD